MKIGFDAKRIYLNNTGLGSYSRNLVNALNKYAPQTDITLFTTERSGISKKEFDDSTFHVISPSGFWSKRFKSLWRRKTIGKLAAKEKLDIYHGLSNEIPVNIQKQGVKSVVTIHDLIFMRYPKWYPSVDRRFYEKKIRQAVKDADKIICVSSSAKKDLIEFTAADEKKISVIPPSVHPQFYNEPEWHVRNYLVNTYNLQSRFILNVASFTERKNQLTLLKAYKLLTEKMSDVELVLIGDGKEYRQQVVQYIKENNLLNKVQMIDNCSTERLTAFYRLASLFVYPSLYEGFGMPVSEAMYSRVPVVVSRNSCFEETAGPSAIYIDAQNEKELADAMMQVLDNPREGVRMADENFKYAQQFADKPVIAQLSKLYATL